MAQAAFDQFNADVLALLLTCPVGVVGDTPVLVLGKSRGGARLSSRSRPFCNHAPDRREGRGVGPPWGSC